MAGAKRMAAIIAGVAGLMAASGLVHGQDAPGQTLPQTPAADAPPAVRGAYLARVGDCEGCHDRPGGAPLAGGRELKTPFGLIYSTNITPDPESGIGAWSAAEFRKAMVEGKAPHGRRLYPAFPYPHFAKATAEDIDALYAYLRTVAPVKAAPRPNALRFPYNIRALMKLWNWLNFDRRPFTPDPDRSAEWNRGAYIVEGLGHCGACHTPKTWMGAERTDRAFHGADIEEWFAPDLTGPGKSGLRDWTADDIVTYLRTGANHHAEATGAMTDVVAYSTSHLSDADLHAIAVYLKGLDVAPAHR